MNETQARRYLASLAKTPELENGDIISISFDGCRVDFTSSQDALSWHCRVFPPAGAVTGSVPDLGKDLLGILLEANGLGSAAAFSMNAAGEMLVRGSTLLDGLTEEMLAAQVAEFIDYAEYWQQQLASSAT